LTVPKYQGKQHEHEKELRTINGSPVKIEKKFVTRPLMAGEFTNSFETAALVEAFGAGLGGDIDGEVLLLVIMILCASVLTHFCCLDKRYSL